MNLLGQMNHYPAFLIRIPQNKETEKQNKQKKNSLHNYGRVKLKNMKDNNNIPEQINMDICSKILA